MLKNLFLCKDNRECASTTIIYGLYLENVSSTSVLRGSHGVPAKKMMIMMI